MWRWKSLCAYHLQQSEFCKLSFVFSSKPAILYGAPQRIQYHPYCPWIELLRQSWAASCILCFFSQLSSSAAKIHQRLGHLVETVIPASLLLLIIRRCTDDLMRDVLNRILKHMVDYFGHCRWGWKWWRFRALASSFPFSFCEWFGNPSTVIMSKGGTIRASY